MLLTIRSIYLNQSKVPQTFFRIVGYTNFLPWKLEGGRGNCYHSLPFIYRAADGIGVIHDATLPRQVSLYCNQQSVSDSTLEFALFMLRLHRRVEAVMKMKGACRGRRCALGKRDCEKAGGFVP